ncbi:MAG: PqqD family protein [Alphaproteobacteria bacterium]|nr:PqqD family protein [Alphaproteobacteria bacterium]
MTNHTSVCRRGDVLSAEVNGEIVLMSVDQGEYVGLDEIASDLWMRIERPLTIEALVAQLADAYDGDRAVIERDVGALLSEMAANGLVDLG